MSINLLDLRHLRIGTKEEISSIINIRDGQFSVCTENETIYVFVLNGSKYLIDNEKVLSSDVSSDSRWIYANANVPFGYSYEFDKNDWVLDDTGDNYKLVVEDSNHVIQTDKTLIQIYDYQSNLVGVTNIGKENGLYVLTTCVDPDCRFKGRAIIIPTNKV